MNVHGHCSYILEDEGGVSTIEIPPNVGPNIKANAVSQMEAAMAALSAELNKLRTGRASPGILLVVIVVYKISPCL